MKNYNKLIPIAFDAIKEHLADKPEKVSVKKVYNGYISQFGASIVMSGLLATLAMNSQEENTGGEANKTPLLNAIQDVIVKEELSGLKELETSTLFKFALDNSNDKGKIALLQNRISDAAIAIKIALRTFKLVKE